MNNYESAAMWKLYLKTNEGIAIQTTCKKLIEALDKIAQPVYISIVKYIDYDNDFIDEFGNIMSPFVHKRKSFIHNTPYINFYKILWYKCLFSSCKIRIKEIKIRTSYQPI